MRTQFFAPREQPAPVSDRGQQDMLRRVREEVEVIAKQAGDTRHQLRRGQTPTGGAGLADIENSCLNALAVLDTAELPPVRSGGSNPWKRKAHATLSAPAKTGLYTCQAQGAAQIREHALQLVSEMTQANFGRTRTTSQALSEMIGVSNRLAEIEQFVPARRTA